MGQRLVTIITKGDKEILTTYQHWGGYSDCAIRITNQYLEAILDLKEEDRTTGKIAKTFYEKELISGVCEKSVAMLKKIGIDVPQHTNRNVGLCSIEAKEMADLQSWAEMIAYIDLNTLTIDLTWAFDGMSYAVLNYLWQHDLTDTDFSNKLVDILSAKELEITGLESFKKVLNDFKKENPTMKDEVSKFEDFIKEIYETCEKENRVMSINFDAIDIECSNKLIDMIGYVQEKYFPFFLNNGRICMKSVY